MRLFRPTLSDVLHFGGGGGFGSMASRAELISGSPGHINTQFTSVHTGGNWGLQRPWFDDLPTGPFATYAWHRIIDWGPNGEYANLHALNCAGAYVQILGWKDGSNNHVTVYEGEGVAPNFTSLYSVSNYTGWGASMIRNNGAGGPTEVLFLPKGGSLQKLVLPDYGQLQQWYLAGMEGFGEQVEDGTFASAWIYNRWVNDADFITQTQRDVALYSADLNAQYTLHTAAGVQHAEDTSGHDRDANPSGNPTTASDSPYL